MKQLIIDKIDRLIEKGYQVEETEDSLKIGEIEAVFKDYTMYKECSVKWCKNLGFDDSLCIYEYLRKKKQQQFIEYLKGD